ncbi:MAG: hypothetical protein M3Q69_02045 [Acidobacteriota bacterium]|nr:hypothetical protein [Acidobacteriota bacterium]
MDLKSALFEYLKQSGDLEAKHLGGEAQPTSVADSTSWLRGYLKERVRFNDRLVVTAVGLLALLFLTGIALAVYYRHEPAVMSSILGGDCVSVLGVIAWIWRMIVEKTRIDLAIAIIEGLPPEQAAAFLQTMYESMGKARATASTQTAST